MCPSPSPEIYLAYTIDPKRVECTENDRKKNSAGISNKDRDQKYKIKRKKELFLNVSFVEAHNSLFFKGPVTSVFWSSGFL